MLHPFARRIHRRDWLRRVCFCACIGVGAGLVLLLISFFVPIPYAAGIAAGVAALVFGACALAAYFIRPRPARLAAEIDRCGFKERVQTMLSLHGDDTAFAALQREDTARALQAANPKACVPIRLPKKILILAALGVLAGFLLGFVPNPQRSVLDEKEETRQVLQKQAERVEALQEDLKKNNTLDDAARAELNEQLRDLARELRGGQDYKESIKQISAIQQELGKMKEEHLQSQLDAMQSAFAKQPSTRHLAEALENPEEAAETLRQAAEEALKDKDGPAAKELAQALQQAAAQATDSAVSEALGDLADAIERGDADAAAEALDKLESALQNTAASSGLQSLDDQLQYAKGSLGQLSPGGQSGSKSQSGQQGQNGENSQGQSGGQGSGQGQGQGQSPGQGQGSGQGQGAGAGSGDVVEGEKIYDGSRLAGQGAQVQLQGDKQNGSPGLQGEVNAGAGTLDGHIPYQQVVGEYEQSAIRAAERAQLPPAMQDWVQEYFAALQDG